MEFFFINLSLLIFMTVYYCSSPCQATVYRKNWLLLFRKIENELESKATKPQESLNIIATKPQESLQIKVTNPKESYKIVAIKPQESLQIEANKSQGSLEIKSTKPQESLQIRENTFGTKIAEQQDNLQMIENALDSKAGEQQDNSKIIEKVLESKAANPQENVQITENALESTTGEPQVNLQIIENALESKAGRQQDNLKIIEKVLESKAAKPQENVQITENVLESTAAEPQDNLQIIENALESKAGRQQDNLKIIEKVLESKAAKPHKNLQITEIALESTAAKPQDNLQILDNVLEQQENSKIIKKVLESTVAKPQESLQIMEYPLKSNASKQHNHSKIIVKVLESKAAKPQENAQIIENALESQAAQIQESLQFKKNTLESKVAKPHKNLQIIENALESKVAKPQETLLVLENEDKSETNTPQEGLLVVKSELEPDGKLFIVEKEPESESTNSEELLQTIQKTENQHIFEEDGNSEIKTQPAPEPIFTQNTEHPKKYTFEERDYPASTLACLSRIVDAAKFGGNLEILEDFNSENKSELFALPVKNGARDSELGQKLLIDVCTQFTSGENTDVISDVCRDILGHNEEKSNDKPKKVVTDGNNIKSVDGTTNILSDNGAQMFLADFMKTAPPASSNKETRDYLDYPDYPENVTEKVNEERPEHGDTNILSSGEAKMFLADFKKIMPSDGTNQKTNNLLGDTNITVNEKEPARRLEELRDTAELASLASGGLSEDSKDPNRVISVPIKKIAQPYWTEKIPSPFGQNNFIEKIKYEPMAMVENRQLTKSESVGTIGNPDWKKPKPNWKESNPHWKGQNPDWKEERTLNWEEQNPDWKEQQPDWKEPRPDWKEQNQGYMGGNPHWKEQKLDWKEQHTDWKERTQNWKEQNPSWKRQNPEWKEQNHYWNEINPDWKENKEDWKEQQPNWKEQKLLKDEQFIDSICKEGNELQNDKDVIGNMLGSLVKYICGDNKEDQKIELTEQIWTQVRDNQDQTVKLQMCYMMPSNVKANPPLPHSDSGISLVFPKPIHTYVRKFDLKSESEYKYLMKKELATLKLHLIAKGLRQQVDFKSYFVSSYVASIGTKKEIFLLRKGQDL